jgi:hypothetical protein
MVVLYFRRAIQGRQTAALGKARRGGRPLAHVPSNRTIARTAVINSTVRSRNASCTAHPGRGSSANAIGTIWGRNSRSAPNVAPKTASDTQDTFHPAFIGRPFAATAADLFDGTSSPATIDVDQCLLNFQRN